MLAPGSFCGLAPGSYRLASPALLSCLDLRLIAFTLTAMTVKCYFSLLPEVRIQLHLLLPTPYFVVMG